MCSRMRYWSNSSPCLRLSMSVDDAVRAYNGRKMADCVAVLKRLLRQLLPDSFVPDLRARTAAAFATRLKPMAGGRPRGHIVIESAVWRGVQRPRGQGNRAGTATYRACRCGAGAYSRPSRVAVWSPRRAEGPRLRRLCAPAFARAVCRLGEKRQDACRTADSAATRKDVCRIAGIR